MKTVCKKLFSLVLVAILLVSAVPFQAFADGVTYYDVKVTVNDASGSQTLTVSVAEGDNLIVNAANLKQWNYVNNNSTGYVVTGVNGEAVAEKWYGINATSYAQEIVVTVANNPTQFTLTLNANGGKFSDESTTKTYNVTYGQAIPAIADAVRTDYTFLGWFENADGTGAQLTSAQNWNVVGNKTYYAKFDQNMSTLQIKAMYYVNGVNTKTVALDSKTLPETQFVLTYLINNASSLFTVPAGYTWDQHFYDYTGTQTLTQQDLDNSAERSVCVKFTANAYTLYFNANGGSVDPTSKTVYFDQAVGSLPTPTKKGGVFSHWEDNDGKTYTASTIYKVAGNTQLTARWKNEAYVLLAIHSDTTSNPIYVQMNGYLKGDEISQSAVQKVVTNYYGGSTMSLAGLYTDAAWADYVAGKNPTAEASFTVTTDEANVPNVIHVLVKNGSLGGNSSTGSTSATNGTSSTTATKEADSTNPKTGDNSMIYVSMTVMVMAAVAVTALYLGRKKRMF